MQIPLSEGQAESERWDESCMEPYMTTVPKSAEFAIVVMALELL